jgi:hypothetical protein
MNEIKTLLQKTNDSSAGKLILHELVRVKLFYIKTTKDQKISVYGKQEQVGETAY